MSYTKKTFQENFLSPVSDIQRKTLDDNDLTQILGNLNCCIHICEKINEKDPQIGKLWNEIISDIISSIHAATSGFYRLAMGGIRSILELSCSSFYYYDHKIEYYLFLNENFKADKYVSALINEHNFFKTKYIKSFNNKINHIEFKEDSVSLYLKDRYSNLCDIVHGRFNALTRTEDLKINYDKVLFKKFEAELFATLSIISVLYLLRFEDNSSLELIELANHSRVIKF